MEYQFALLKYLIRKTGARSVRYVSAVSHFEQDRSNSEVQVTADYARTTNPLWLAKLLTTACR